MAPSIVSGRRWAGPG